MALNILKKNTYNTRVGGKSGPPNARETDYYRSGEHKSNALAARELALEKQRQQKIERVEKYYANPTRCKKCNAPLKYNKKRNVFCSKSCAATFNNTGRVVSEEQKLKTSRTHKKRLKIL